MRRRPQISHLCHRWKMWRLSHLGFLLRIGCREMSAIAKLKTDEGELEQGFVFCSPVHLQDVEVRV